MAPGTDMLIFPQPSTGARERRTNNPWAGRAVPLPPWARAWLRRRARGRRVERLLYKNRPRRGHRAPTKRRLPQNRARYHKTAPTTKPLGIGRTREAVATAHRWPPYGPQLAKAAESTVKSSTKNPTRIPNLACFTSKTFTASLAKKIRWILHCRFPWYCGRESPPPPQCKVERKVQFRPLQPSPSRMRQNPTPNSAWADVSLCFFIIVFLILSVCLTVLIFLLCPFVQPPTQKIDQFGSAHVGRFFQI